MTRLEAHWKLSMAHRLRNTALDPLYRHLRGIFIMQQFNYLAYFLSLYLILYTNVVLHYKVISKPLNLVKSSPQRNFWAFFSAPSAVFVAFSASKAVWVWHACVTLWKQIFTIIEIMREMFLTFFGFLLPSPLWYMLQLKMLVS